MVSTSIKLTKVLNSVKQKALKPITSIKKKHYARVKLSA